MTPTKLLIGQILIVFAIAIRLVTVLRRLEKAVARYNANAVKTLADWQKRESARTWMRILVKRILKRYRSDVLPWNVTS
jgi:acetyl-CoA carboxylase alpha subunit